MPPGKNTVEFKLIFTKEDYDLARDLCLKNGYPLLDGLSAEHPVADRLEDLHMMMLLLEKETGAKEAEWKKGGKHLAKVERFKITVTLPRASLIQTALKRGLSHSRITEYQLDPNIDTETISNEINSLPIPDEIKYPVSIEDEDKINE